MRCSRECVVGLGLGLLLMMMTRPVGAREREESQPAVENAEAEKEQGDEDEKESGLREKLIGQPFELTGETLAGEPFDLKTLRGKVVLVEFWATWCPACLDQMAHLKRLYRGYRGKGLEIVGVSCDDAHDDLDKFQKLFRLPWTTLHDREKGADHPAALRYRVEAFPTTFLLDKEGKVLAADLSQRELHKKMRELLGTPEPTPTIETQGFPVLEGAEVYDRLLDTAESWLDRKDVKRGEELAKNPPATCKLSLAAPRTERLSAAEAYRQAQPSVFVLGTLVQVEDSEEWEIATSTAFAVTADGVLSTSAHVFDFTGMKAGPVVAMDVQGKFYPVTEVLALDEVTDTCLFRIPAEGLKPLSLGDSVPPGTEVRVLSHPGDAFYYLSCGHVANYDIDEDGVAWVNVTADFGQGSSGAPVMDDCGNVVGQVSRTSTLFATPGLGLPEEEPRPKKARRQMRLANQKLAEEEPAEKEEESEKEVAASETLGDEYQGEPQMVLRSCTPVVSLKKLLAE